MAPAEILSFVFCRRNFAAFQPLFRPVPTPYYWAKENRRDSTHESPSKKNRGTGAPLLSLQ